MYYAIIAAVAVAVIVGIVFTVKRNKKILENGIEVEAVVSRIVTDWNEDDNGNREKTETYYVRYRTDDGQTVEAKLSNPPAHCFEGTKLRVKYLPEKPKYVVAVK